ncbi:type II secretion system protein GspD [Burkholderia stagnalis]|uniref:type II secretion system protein GspD n=1 Tax=Burkholderia stagnalis TaxID=1503054 RepID=UPI0007589C88|nr:type II secretory pathway protein [Burkholderia stagnalis]KVL92061.1 type II secretory pathway protein [Burkholderia stagnalis]KVL97651.1 type II secretory pathway protein [Burkholderia stagnalis]KVM11707.1 type II secretory pathway protein [Burkholderia stagnalis]
MKRWFGVLCGVLVSWSVAAVEAPPIPTLPGLGASGPVVPALMPVTAESMPSVPLRPLPRVKGGAFDLRYVSVGQLVDLLYGDAMHVPHVIDSGVLQDTRLVSFQYDGKTGDLRSFVKLFLDSQGFKVETRDGVDFVSKQPTSEVREPELETFVYRPRFRTADYLAKAVRPLFSGRFNMTGAAGEVSPIPDAPQPPLGASSVAAMPSLPHPLSGVSSADELVFTGKASEVRDLRRLLPELDQKPGEVVVRGWVYEVSNTTDKNSAFSLVAKVFNGVGGSLSASNGLTDADPTALRFSSNYLNLVISALNADTRFKQVSDPHVRVLSGDRVRLNVGSQVPTLGSISYQGVSGTPVQSVQYQDAGLIFDVRPTVMADAIQVELQEQMSSFVATTTGVNNSPTKNTRQMRTTVSMKDGEVIVLGGLVQDTDTATTNSPGWLPRFLDGHGSSRGRTEVLLVLQVQRV